MFSPQIMMRAVSFLISLFVVLAVQAENVAPEQIRAFPVIGIERGGEVAAIDLAEHIHDPDVPGTAVRINVKIGREEKNIDLALFDEQTPLTVANFVAYIEAGRYADNFIHRSVPGFMFQGGGFCFVDDFSAAAVPTFPPVQNEPGISNVRGTIAMAKIGGDPNSATSQWFINLADNRGNLDIQNGGFTAFGRVLGSGMAVADEVAGLPLYDKSSIHGAWNTIPLENHSGSLVRSNFIETNISVIPALSFAATVADPDLLAVAISGSTLSLEPKSSQAGETVVTISVTDLDGAMRSFDLPVQVWESFHSWESNWDFSTPDDVAGVTSDPDGDGWGNLLEFAFGGSPIVAGVPPQRLRLEADGAVTFGHRKYANLHYSVERSGDLETWTPVWTSEDTFSAAAVADHVEAENFDVLTIRPPSALGERVFWRVVVEPAD